MKKIFAPFLAIAMCVFLLVACAPAKSAGVDMDLVSSLVQKILEAVLPVIALQVVAYLYNLFQEQRAKLSDGQRWLLDQGIDVAIMAAEKLYKSGEGEKKKEYALKVAQEWIAQYGLKLNLTLLEAQIESRVLSQFPKPLPVVGGSAQG
jgi:hypothetical protein